MLLTILCSSVILALLGALPRRLRTQDWAFYATGGGEPSFSGVSTLLVLCRS